MIGRHGECFDVMDWVFACPFVDVHFSNDVFEVLRLQKTHNDLLTPDPSQQCQENHRMLHT